MNPLVDSRAETWQWQVLDKRTEAPIGYLDGVLSGHLDWSIFNRIRMGGSLSWSGTSLANEWNAIRLKPIYTAVTPSGVVTWPMGVYLPAAPTTAYVDGLRSSNVELYDKLLVLDQDNIESAYTVAAGAVVTDTVRTVIAAASAFATTTSVVSSSETLRTDMAWEVGTSRLTIVNDLLAAINYFSLSVDRNGVYQATPYVTPSQRGAQWPFADDSESIYTPDVSNEQDLFTVPNKVVLVAQGDDSAAALTSIATNMNPSSKSSYPSRGRWITVVDTNVQATSQTVLDAMAARRLAEASQPQSTLTLKHAHLPLDLNDAVTFTNSDSGRTNALAVVQTMALDTVAGSLSETKLLEVVT